jgi:hypothetical protein
MESFLEEKANNGFNAHPCASSDRSMDSITLARRERNGMINLAGCRRSQPVR